MRGLKNIQGSINLETYVQVKKQQLELGMEQTGSK